MYSLSIPSITISLLSLCSTISAFPVIPRDTSPPSQDWDTWHGPSSASLPVMNGDFPDPSFIKAPDGYYAFATSSNGRNIQVAKSSSFSNPSWSLLNVDALPDPGPWTDHSHAIWAPYVAQTTKGSFVMYYAAPPYQNATKHCVGTATSNSIAGPYTPASTPFACDLSVGGSIDPSIFKDPKSGNTYVMYKIDGNSLGSGSHPTPIMLQQVDPADLVTRIGAPVKILDQDPNSNTDGPLVEAPTMMYMDGTYFLLFSTNYYNTDAYDIRYVTSSSIQGPFSSAQSELLQTGDRNGVKAPGSCDAKDGMIVFHGTVVQDPLSRSMYAGYVEAHGTALRYIGPV